MAKKIKKNKNEASYLRKLTNTEPYPLPPLPPTLQP